MQKGFALVVATTALVSVAFGTEHTVPGDFGTIQGAIDASQPGDRIIVGPGNHAGAYVYKQVEIKGEGGAVINTGPIHGSGMTMGFRLRDGSSGSTFSHLTFAVDLAIIPDSGFAGYGPVDDITVTQCTFTNVVQGVSCWRGQGWQITHNQFNNLRTNNGGGIAILIGDYFARPEGVSDNVVSHNTVSGTLHVMANDGGGYNGTGIVLYADFRYGFPGATSISYNRIVKNKVNIVSDTPNVVDIAAFEMTDTRTTWPTDIIQQNSVGFNDWRDMLLQVVLTPSSLDAVNAISRNFGENRGQGMHPKAFGPGGN